MSSEAVLRAEVIHVCHRLDARGLIAGADGNVSVRLDDGNLLITPTGTFKGELRPEDLVVVDLDGHLVSGNHLASSEVWMHIRIYRRRIDVRAVVHAHPPTATAFAVAGEDFMTPVLPEVVLQMGGVPLVPYATPGSDQLAAQFEPFLTHHDAFLMANHGATTVGPTLTIAQQRMESLEHAARVMLAARQLGSVRVLSGAQAADVRASGAPARGNE